MLVIMAYSILIILLSVVITSYIAIIYGEKRRVILPVKNKNSTEQNQIVYEKLKQAPGPKSCQERDPIFGRWNVNPYDSGNTCLYGR